MGEGWTAGGGGTSAAPVVVVVVSVAFSSFSYTLVSLPSDGFALAALASAGD